MNSVMGSLSSYRINSANKPKYDYGYIFSTSVALDTVVSDFEIFNANCSLLAS